MRRRSTDKTVAARIAAARAENTALRARLQRARAAPVAGVRRSCDQLPLATTPGAPESPVVINLADDEDTSTAEETAEETAEVGDDPPAQYTCYTLLSSPPAPGKTRRTYVGITNNERRRLRQHNGDLVGGAKYTRTGRPWTVVYTVGGFLNRQQALQFEWAVRHKGRRRAPGKNATHII